MKAFSISPFVGAVATMCFAGMAFVTPIQLAPLAGVFFDQWTVVTLARDGSWGVATASSQGEAIAAAVRDCQAMAGAGSDCGAQLVATRGSWAIANLCGDHKIIVAAETREGVEEAALLREAYIKRVHVPDMPPCARVLTVDPRGVVYPGHTAPAPRVDARRKEH